MESFKMKAQQLIDTAKAMVADGKGLLAMDESLPTCNKRFAEYDIPQTVELRRAYRELLITTPSLGESISGAILFDETIRQKTKDGMLLDIERLTIVGEKKWHEWLTTFCKPFTKANIRYSDHSDLIEARSWFSEISSNNTL